MLFYTLAPKVVPENLVATFINATTILVKWHSVENVIGFRGYRIKFAAVKEPSHEYSVVVDTSASMGTLTRLKPFTKYKIQVAARSTQEGNYSSALYVKTKQGGKVR